jgi:rSAM/selenodomain-associated transferase 1
VQLYLQEGDDLGARMFNALSEGLKEFAYAIVIGCDCPWLTREDLELASDSLTGDKDAVLGPAVDGGYYLLGLNSAQNSLFENIPWGSASVLPETRRRLAEAGISWHELMEHPDLDRPEDLKAYEELIDARV